MQPSFIILALLAALSMAAFGCQPAGYALIADATPPEEWPTAEGRILTNVRQLTFVDMGLTKSGEAYFSPDQRRIIFQAWPAGEKDYQMYTLELTADGRPLRDTLRMVSPGGGACTCGFFKPDGSGIIFCSSFAEPNLVNPFMSGYKRQGSGYVWDMPGGMEIYAADLDGSNRRRLTDSVGYDAECAYDPTGEYIVFCSDRRGDPDLFIMKADGSDARLLVGQKGYEGGPFFSPDGKRVIYRADRQLNDYLQLYVINVEGTGERQLTRDGPVVNWAPFWHPNGRVAAFATSLHGHRNYEVYLLDIDSGRSTRATYSPAFDGLPVFSPDGRRMMWTSQRGPDGSSQIFLADFTLPAGLGA